MKKCLFTLIIMLISITLFAQKAKQGGAVALPPDEVTIVDHVVKEGETVNTIWESYGQKFVFKEYKKYNEDAWIKKGMILHVPIHTTDPNYLTKGQYNSVVAKYSASPSSSSSPANAKASASITKMKLSPYNGEEFHMYIETKGQVLWLGQQLVGIEYEYYDSSHKKVLKTDSYTQKVKKDEYKLSTTESFPYAELPHKNGENGYAVRVKLYNPQDNDAILAVSDYLDISLTWEGNKVRTTNPTTSDRILNLLSGLEAAVSVSQQSGTSSSSSSTSSTNTTRTQSTGTSTTRFSSATAHTSATTSSARSSSSNSYSTTQASSTQLSSSEMYLYDAELDYALTHTNNPEANKLMVQAIEINRNAKMLAKRLDNLNAEYKAQKDQINRESATGVRSTTTSQNMGNGTTVTTINNRSIKTTGSNYKEQRMKELDNWYQAEHKKLMAEASQDHGLNAILDRYHTLTGIPQEGRSKSVADDSGSECVWCHGSGICYRCKGGGAGDTHYGVTGKCPDCHGSGKCSHCGKSRGGSQSTPYSHWPDPDRARAMLITGTKNTTQQRTSSGGGSTTTTKETDVVVDCGYCHGSGDCYKCNGHGVLERGTSNEHSCFMCRNFKLGKCTYCKGTGKVTRKVNK